MPVILECFQKLKKDKDLVAIADEEVIDWHDRFIEETDDVEIGEMI